MNRGQGHGASHFGRPFQVSEGDSGSPPPRRWRRGADSTRAVAAAARADTGSSPDPAGPAGPGLPPHSRARPGGLVAHLTPRSRPQRHEGLSGRPVSPRSALQPTASRATTQPDAPVSALRPQPHTTGLDPPLRGFPAPGRSHTPPAVLIGSLPHPPWAPRSPIGLDPVPVK